MLPNIELVKSGIEDSSMMMMTMIIDRTYATEIDSTRFHKLYITLFSHSFTGNDRENPT